MTNTCVFRWRSSRSSRLDVATACDLWTCLNVHCLHHHARRNSCPSPLTTEPNVNIDDDDIWRTDDRLSAAMITQRPRAATSDAALLRPLVAPAAAAVRFNRVLTMWKNAIPCHRCVPRPTGIMCRFPNARSLLEEGV